jgi:hypothetical protein
LTRSQGRIAYGAFAHQPRLVDDRPSIIVRDPEISQAFYARSAGNPQTYSAGLIE